MLIRSTQIFVLLVAAMLIGKSTFALPTPTTVVVQIVAAKKIASVDAGGKTQNVWQRLTNAENSVVPGDTLRYEVTSTNHLKHALRGFMLTQPVPQGAEYIFPSATVSSGGEAKLTISIDGGATFSSHPMIEVKSADGSVLRKPAPLSRYTHLRWTFLNDLASGSSAAISSEMRVR